MVPTPNALQQALRFSLNKVKQSSAKVAAAELTQSNELNLSKDSFSTLSLSTNPPLSTTVCSGTSRGTNFQKSSTDAVVVTVVDPAHTNNTPIGEIVEENHAKPTSIAQTARDRKAINESLIYAAIPFLPLPIAIVCFLLNLLLPGSETPFKGTVLAGMAILLVGQPRLEVRETRILLTMLINCCVGVSQFATVTFFLIGWFWSIAWGGLFIMHSIFKMNHWFSDFLVVNS
ncbi:Protein SPEC3 [Trichinella pseudospiralis]|uniref:Protein SPEC3 n=2 Tax=Trichinella pseudospiralis TaxID=6337 RepID=A0A0V1I481_TRIPS|nr:Protein SPEC3 [Trichinella pseudospiralis]KRY85537.1 Protein SPEC3 [Trichinella pseudospiralis]KRZ17188.1 Protein SPEC3 [Trichinella pseudospiralis]KRZ41968.1 Protein SPEC3 [Trichinella pseudospiralis]